MALKNSVLTKFIALTDVDHEKSHRVLEKIGFISRGIEKMEDGDNLVFEITNQVKITTND